MFSYLFSGAKTTNPGSSVEMSPHIESDWVLVDDPAHSEEQPSQLYNIVPNGDVVIVLTHSVSCDDFISWPASDRHTAKDAPALNEWLELVVPGTSDVDSMVGTGSPIKPSKGSQVSLVGGLQTSQSIPRTRLTRTDLGESSTLMDSSASESSDSSNHTWSTIAPALESTSNGANKAPQGPYEYRVSSSHLMAASPVFKDLLNNGEGLGKLRHTDGKIYFTARSVNEKALRILLKILNHQSGGLPPKLELSCLTMLSVLTSQLKCVQAVQWFGEHWCEKAEKQHIVPQEAHLIAMMWLCISFVFKREDRFKEAAQVFLRFSEDDLLPTLGLPIEDALMAIYNKRCETLKAAIDYLFEWKDIYSDLKYVCPIDKQYSEICASMMEGRISRELRGWGLVSRELRVTPLSGGYQDPGSFDGWGIATLCELVSMFHVRKWKTHDKRTHKCDFKELQKGFVQFLDVAIELKDIVGEEDKE